MNINPVLTGFIENIFINATLSFVEIEGTLFPLVEYFNDSLAKNGKESLNKETLKEYFYSMVADEQEHRREERENSEEGIIKKEFIKNKKKGTYDLAHHLTKKFDIITIGEKDREIYVYRDGMYKRAENDLIFPEIQRILGDQVDKSAKNETLHKIADATAKHRSIFESASLNFIPLKNGVYDMTEKKLLPHDSSYRFTYQFPITFDPKADCPKTKEFIDQILTKDQRFTVQEWLGYYFYRLYSFKKAIIFVGEGDTGKTTLLEVITYLLGRENLSSISLHKMSSDKFSAAHLYEKHGNLVDELSAKDISDTGTFKVATGGGSITGEYKFGNQFSFWNYSKLTFACNKIPDVEDFDDEAYFNRWMIIRFQNTIINKIPNFIHTLTTEEERSGLFNYAMEGLQRLLEQKSFTYNKTAIDTKKEMMRSGSSIAMFAADCLYQEAGVEITKEAMYEAYTEYCIKNELPAATIKMLGTKLPFYVTYVSDGLITILGGKRTRGWRNASLVKGQKELQAEEAFNNF